MSHSTFLGGGGCSAPVDFLGLGRLPIRLDLSLYWPVAKILATEGVEQNINLSHVIT